MKKTVLLFLSLILITSCSKDDGDNEKQNEASIVGVWKLQKTQRISGKDKSVIAEYLGSKNDCEEKTTQEYTADGKYISKVFVKSNGECIEDGSEIGTYTYNKESKIINYNRKYGASKLNVEKLTDTELIIWTSLEKDVNNDGINDNVKAIFLRQ